jgi:hypothetical protein
MLPLAIAMSTVRRLLFIARFEGFDRSFEPVVCDLSAGTELSFSSHDSHGRIKLCWNSGVSNANGQKQASHIHVTRRREAVATPARKAEAAFALRLMEASPAEICFILLAGRL